MVSSVVLEEGVELGYMQPFHISERDMVADPMTKYLPHHVWLRHFHYYMNTQWPV